MAEKKTFMPQSTAGLIRYFDSDKEVIKIKPEHVIVAGIMLTVIVVFFRFLI